MDRRRRMMVMAGAGLMAFGALSAAGAWALWPEPDPPVDPRPVASLDAPSTVDAGVDASAEPEPDAGLDARVAQTVEEPDAGARSDEAPVRRTNLRDRRERRLSPRPVLLTIRPADVLVGIDGAAPRPFMTQVRPLQELSPGRHTFTLVPGPHSPHYQGRTFTVVIPPGEGEHRVGLALPLAPVTLRVRSVPGASVEVLDPRGGVRARGRVNDVVSVPMRNEQENLRVRVTMDGYRPYRSAPLPFRVGGPTVDHRAELQPEAP